MKIQLFALIPVLFNLSAQADPRDALTQNLAFMKSVYEAQYAPKEWKKKYANWDLDQAYNDATASATALQTDGISADNAAAREVIKKLIYSTKDYHVSVRFYATEAATLPFSVKSAQGKVFLAYIDRAKLPESSFPFNVGDELVSFAGKPVEQALQEVQDEITANVPTTDRALAEMRLTSRKAASGLKVPNGVVMIAVKPAGAERAQGYEMHWDYTPEFINTFPSGKKLKSASASTFGSIKMAAMDSESAFTAANPFLLGTKKSYLPTLGKKIWQADADNTFDAYMAMNEQRKIIGVLRIPSYSLESPEAYVKAVADFSKIIALFQSTTDGMVIDQINNPGGSVFYLYQLVTMLTDQPMTTPRHRMSLIQEDVNEAVTSLAQLAQVTDDASAKKVLGDNWNGFPVNYEVAKFATGNYQFILSEWNKGKKLTSPYYIGGANLLNPSPVHYDKPLLIVVNELCFSGGDFFPATMQDNKRAKVMGVRTAGAGGYVRTYEYPNSVGIQSFRVTASIAERADLNPIENLGVTPDLNYALTVEDLQGGFQGYKAAVKSAIESLIK